MATATTIDLIKQHKLVVFPDEDEWIAGQLWGSIFFVEESGAIDGSMNPHCIGKTLEEAVEGVAELIEAKKDDNDN